MCFCIARPQFIEKTIEELRTAVKDILNLSTDGLSYVELHAATYALVLRKHGSNLYDTISDAVTDHLCLHVASKIADVSGDEDFLLQLDKRFSEHQKGAEMLTDVFDYLDRVYLKNHGKTGQETVGKLAITLWRECVINNPRIRRRMSSCMLRMIAEERTGAAKADWDALKKVNSMLFVLGEPIYVEEFETRMLEETKLYYRALAVKRIDIDDSPAYLCSVEQWLQDEMDRCDHFMQPRTKHPLFTTVRNEVLNEMSQSILHNATSGIVNMLRNSQVVNLQRLYRLFSTMDELDGIPDAIFNHVREIGKAIVLNVENERNPTQFVEQFFKFKEKYDTILVEAFERNRAIESQCNQAYQLVANMNPRSPESLSLYLDQMLRKPPKDMSENELEGVFVKAMGLFRLFNEKDEFEQYYRKHLRKRLLQKRSASDDNERTFIGKLRDHCGFAFTSKMETMFNDMFTSADLTRSFRDVQNNVPGLKDVDLDVTVLTMGVWPMMKTYSNPIVLPKQCQDAVKAFEWHYGQLHSGRKLNWQLNMGRADIKAAFPSGKYELSVSTLQMCVLMCFQGEQSQGGPRLSLQTIGDMTGLSGDELKVSLEALTCVSGKDILVKSPPGNEMSPTDVFELNKAFKSKTARVKILSSSSKRETDQERSVTRGKLTDDRKPQIEAAIVRIMKAKKRLDYNSIVLEVTSQVRNRFLPTPGDIKKHLEGLIDRDFIGRDPDDRKVYLYRR